MSIVDIFEGIKDKTWIEVINILGLENESLQIPKLTILKDEKLPDSGGGLVYTPSESSVKISEDYIKLEENDCKKREIYLKAMQREGIISSVPELRDIIRIHRHCLLSHEFVHSLHNQIKENKFIEIFNERMKLEKIINDKMSTKKDKFNYFMIIAWLEGFADYVATLIEAKELNIDYKILWQSKKKCIKFDKENIAPYIACSIAPDFFISQKNEDVRNMLKYDSPNFPKYVKKEIEKCLRNMSFNG